MMLNGYYRMTKQTDDYNMLKSFYHKYKLSKARQRVRNSANIGRNPIITETANIKLLYGSTPNDIQIGDVFKICGELISEFNGKITIGNNCLVGPHCVVGAVCQISIGNYVRISNNVIIIDNNNHPVNPADRKIMNSVDYSSLYRTWKYAVAKPIIIEDNVWIGRNSIINKGVRIGKNSIVAAGSIVTKDVPPNCIVAGNPAKVVKTDIDQEPRLIIDDNSI